METLILIKNKILDAKLFKHKKVLWIFGGIALLIMIFLTFLPLSKEVTIPKDEEVSAVDLQLGQFSDKKMDEQINEKTSIASLAVNSSIEKNNLIPNVCSLKLTLVSKERTITPNGNINYVMSLVNNGSINCRNASISIYYADNETFVSSNPQASASNYYWNIGTLAGGEQKNFSITTVGNNQASSTVDTEACASTENGEDSCTNSSVSFGNAIVLNTNTIPLPEPSAVKKPIITLSKGKPSAPVGNISNKEYGTWVWVSPLQMTKTYTNTVIEAAAANNINVIYVTFDDYLEIHTLPNGPDKTAKIKNYSDAVQRIVDAARLKGISVDAEGGARDWGEPQNQWKGLAIIDYVISYNASRPTSKIRGFQYDVEPYLMPTYERNKVTPLTNFISLIDASATRLAGKGIRFSVVLPHFYDEKVRWTPAITYKGVTMHPFNHVLGFLDKLANSSIILMSYRNFAENKDGTIEISKTEIETASMGVHTTKVIIAQETGNVEPSYVTFYNMTKNEYLTQVNIITNAFKDYSQFGGIAVHYIDPFLKLR